jgi:pimeloyl-ACP methyl ester carboxylesterase
VQTGDWADLNGVRLYYAAHGAGDPVVFLHGAFAGDYVWAAQVAELASDYRLFLPEQRGRGRTPDVDGPITYELMTQDTADFIEHVVGGPVAVVGASDGGIIGLHLCLRRPGLVRKLVTIGANYHVNGLVPGSGWTEASADDPAWSRPRQHYAAVSPDGPGHWPIVFAKLQRMWLDEPTLDVSDLPRITAPVLVMSGDDDAVALSHTVSLYEALPQGQLAVIPGSSHAVFIEKPDIVNRLIRDFLQAEGPPQTILPVRRA